MLVDCGGGEVAESREACGARHGVCGGECHWVRAETSLERPQKRLGSNGRLRNSASITTKRRRRYTASFRTWACTRTRTWSGTRRRAHGCSRRTWGRLERPEAERQCLAAEGDGECLPTDVCAPRPPPRKPEEDTWAKAKQGFSVLEGRRPVHQRDVASTTITRNRSLHTSSQRTVIQHVLHKMSETFFELYIIALTDACVRHALLMGVAIIAWARVGAPWALLHLRPGLLRYSTASMVPPGVLAARLCGGTGLGGSYDASLWQGVL